MARVNGQTHLGPTAELDVCDRVGGGDGFASGFFYGLLTGETPEQALRLGWAPGALPTTLPSDTTMATVEQVKAFALVLTPSNPGLPWRDTRRGAVEGRWSLGSRPDRVLIVAAAHLVAPRVGRLFTGRRHRVSRE